jgi:hypothetical protein
MSVAPVKTTAKAMMAMGTSIQRCDGTAAGLLHWERFLVAPQNHWQNIQDSDQ